MTKYASCPKCGHPFKTPKAQCGSLSACAKRQAARNGTPPPETPLVAPERPAPARQAPAPQPAPAVPQRPEDQSADEATPAARARVANLNRARSIMRDPRWNEWRLLHPEAADLGSADLVALWDANPPGALPADELPSPADRWKVAITPAQATLARLTYPAQCGIGPAGSWLIIPKDKGTDALRYIASAAASFKQNNHPDYPVARSLMELVREAVTQPTAHREAVDA